ncbi:ethanolamine utilization protein EutH [Senegalia massiliensis]|uniref:ethanolamine utilization protein EutH n=1 Tax=Senegalia massiliensis TaxID=1720316 RepID=UPI00102F44E2|nr:ethanolamine utilization protein EutH [Senegalia massiliensis]
MSNLIIMIIISFSIISAIDKVIGNKMNLGNHFEEGFKSMGGLALTMLGIYTISPLIAKVISPLLFPISKVTGIDPSIFIGIFLAPDMGGFNASLAIAHDAQIGLFSGLILSSMLGATLVFTIPIALGMIKDKDKKHFSKGILYGIITIPLGSLVSGVMMGIDFDTLLLNHIPILLFSIMISMGLFLCPDKLFNAFERFNKFILLLSTFGLIVGILKFTLGISIFNDIIPIEEGLVVIGKIAIILSGAYPLVSFISEKLEKGLSSIGNKLNVNKNSILGVITSLVNTIPMISIYDKMDNKGKVINSAFAVSASFVFGGQMAFVLGVSPDIIGPFIVGKIVAGISSIIVIFVSTKEYGSYFKNKKFRRKHLAFKIKK